MLSPAKFVIAKQGLSSDEQVSHRQLAKIVVEGRKFCQIIARIVTI